MTVEEIEVIGEVLPQYHFVHHKPYMMWSGVEPGLPLKEADD
jgi:hypothetical protein